MTESLPTSAVLRVSPGSFDPSRFEEVEAMNNRISEYLMPAISQLPGLLHFYASVSPSGSIIHVSVWDSEEHARQLDNLTEMTVVARGEAEAAGVTFQRIENNRIGWTI